MLILIEITRLLAASLGALDTFYLKCIINAMYYLKLVLSPLLTHDVGSNFKLVASTCAI